MHEAPLHEILLKKWSNESPYPGRGCLTRETSDGGLLMCTVDGDAVRLGLLCTSGYWERRIDGEALRDHFVTDVGVEGRSLARYADCFDAALRSEPLHCPACGDGADLTLHYRLGAGMAVTGTWKLALVQGGLGAALTGALRMHVLGRVEGARGAATDDSAGSSAAAAAAGSASDAAAAAAAAAEREQLAKKRRAMQARSALNPNFRAVRGRGGRGGATRLAAAKLDDSG
ncbi:hypothetical protein JKP88DRAFT_331068 [Tribonema minus]|uniref:Uncharacterized protein n=1 Tax=Tribonema minus TaxID=303371 RepID=A0A835YM54_9STRA|nr:hypothetical protein JKP88DRAFT_331068 [Tribonema minus]